MTSRALLMISLGIILTGSAAIFFFIDTANNPFISSTDRQRNLHPLKATEPKEWKDA